MRRLDAALELRDPRAERAGVVLLMPLLRLVEQAMPRHDARPLREVCGSRSRALLRMRARLSLARPASRTCGAVG